MPVSSGATRGGTKLVSDQGTAGRLWPTVLGIIPFVAATMMGVAAANAQDGADGITQRTVFPAFDSTAPACHPPPGLAKVLAFVQENEREFQQGVDHGLEMAAKDRGLEYRKALADNDAAKAAEEVRSFLASKVGALVATSSDPAVVRHSLQEVIWSGGFVGTIVPPPATLLLNAPQYATGKALTDAAIRHINTELGGKAAVVLLTQDTMQFLTPRFEAMRDGLSKLPGVTIVADIAPSPVNKQGGFDTMKTILLANSNVDVVLGGDAVVLGALQALRAAGKDRPDQFLGGIDGEPEAVSEIKKGNSPFKASIALSSPVFGYAMGRYAGDWLEGKSIPQAMDILPTALTKDNIAQYEADLADPAAAYLDPVRRRAYLNMYGNICYDTRGQYVNFPWSSEQK
jgi:ribose transport system substrate-binding protein